MPPRLAVAEELDVDEWFGLDLKRKEEADCKVVGLDDGIDSSAAAFVTIFTKVKTSYKENDKMK